MGFKVGDIIECIDNMSYPDRLTIGKKYIVIDTDKDGDVIIKHDNGENGLNFKSRFKLAENNTQKEGGEFEVGDFVETKDGKGEKGIVYKIEECPNHKKYCKDKDCPGTHFALKDVGADECKWCTPYFKITKKHKNIKGETKMAKSKSDINIRGIVADMYSNILNAQVVDKFFGEELRSVDALLMSDADKVKLLKEAKRLQKEEDDKE